MSDITVKINNPTVAVQTNDTINVSQILRPINAEITETTYALEITATTISVTLSPTSINVTTNAQGPAGVPGLIWRGDYSGATNYIASEGVFYLGSSYICILASLANLPTDTTYWELLAQRGGEGPPGTTNYNELDNIPSTFNPSAHSHPISDVT